MAICAACGKPITMEQGSYYAKSPLDDIGNTYHSGCGDPLGIKAAVAAEREACAKVAEAEHMTGPVPTDFTERDQIVANATCKVTARAIAVAIRARV